MKNLNVNIANCNYCIKTENRFSFCSGNCDMSKEAILNKLKKGEIQFLNDSHNSELFCYLTHDNLKYNAFNYYYGYNDYCATQFKDIPVVKISDVI